MASSQCPACRAGPSDVRVRPHRSGGPPRRPLSSGLRAHGPVARRRGRCSVQRRELCLRLAPNPGREHCCHLRKVDWRRRDSTRPSCYPLSGPPGRTHSSARLPLEPSARDSDSGPACRPTPRREPPAGLSHPGSAIRVVTRLRRSWRLPVLADGLAPAKPPCDEPGRGVLGFRGRREWGLSRGSPPALTCRARATSSACSRVGGAPRLVAHHDVRTRWKAALGRPVSVGGRSQ